MNKDSLKWFSIGVLSILLIAATSVDGLNSNLIYQPLQSVGSNVGDSDVTLTPNSSAPTQIFSTALTGARTITLSTTGAINGTTWHVIRSGLGVGTLAIGGLITLPTLTATWATVRYNGPAYILIAYGVLAP